MPQLLGVGALDGMGINTPDRIIVVTRSGTTIPGALFRTPQLLILASFNSCIAMLVWICNT